MQTLQKSKKMTLGEIPDGWELINLGNERVISKAQSGGTPLTSEKKYWDGNIPFVKIEDITSSRKYLLKTKNMITKEGLENSSAWIVPLNSLLLSLYASYGEVVINKIPVATNQAILSIILNDTVDLEFLYYQLKFLKTSWSKNIQENTQKNLNAEIAKKFSILLPPLNEQQNIATILSKVDELIQKTDQIIAQTQRLKKGLMQSLLTKGIGHTKFKKVWIGSSLEQYPVEWNISKMEDLCLIERGKFAHRPRNDPNYYNGKYPFIQTGDVVKSEGYINSFSQTLNEKGLAVSRLFPAGIITITIAANIGSTAITTFPVCFPDSIVGISTTRMNIRFLEYYLQTRKKLLESKATVSAQHNINLETLKPLLVPVPSLIEQDNIVSTLSSIDSHIHILQNYDNELQHVKKGLMQQLLTGKIRVKV